MTIKKAVQTAIELENEVRDVYRAACTCYRGTGSAVAWKDVLSVPCRDNVQ